MIKKEEINLLMWLDMEMTGLDVEKERPIEVAVLLTDWKFEEKASFHRVIRQPPELLRQMDDWNQKHHKSSGLLDLIPGGTETAQVDQELSKFIGSHFGLDRAVLAGNSINQDRLFIRKYLPLTESCLHYRMLDVTAWKLVFNNMHAKKFKKAEAHRALDDIRESIAEFQYYLSFVKTGEDSL